MRKPRDIDAELKALAEKAKGLKAQRLSQLGELVLLTGADALDLDTLAGALLAAAKESDPQEKEVWRSEGAAFFLSRRRKARTQGGAAAEGVGASVAGRASGDAAS